jgi:hypothetical protein
VFGFSGFAGFHRPAYVVRSFSTVFVLAVDGKSIYHIVMLASGVVFISGGLGFDPFWRQVKTLARRLQARRVVC